MFCKNCGFNVDGSKFCPNCGTKVDVIEPSGSDGNNLTPAGSGENSILPAGSDGNTYVLPGYKGHLFFTVFIAVCGILANRVIFNMVRTSAAFIEDSPQRGALISFLKNNPDSLKLMSILNLVVLSAAVVNYALLCFAQKKMIMLILPAAVIANGIVTIAAAGSCAEWLILAAVSIAAAVLMIIFAISRKYTFAILAVLAGIAYFILPSFIEHDWFTNIYAMIVQGLNYAAYPILMTAAVNCANGREKKKEYEEKAARGEINPADLIKKKMSRKAKVIIAACTLTVVIGGGLTALLIIKPWQPHYRVIRGSELFNVYFYGYNGEGYAGAQFSIDPEYALRELGYEIPDMEYYYMEQMRREEAGKSGIYMKPYKEFDRYYIDSWFIPSEEQLDVLFERKESTGEFKMYAQVMQTSGLKNGDRVKVKVHYDQDDLHEVGLELTEDVFYVNVRGLRERKTE